MTWLTMFSQPISDSDNKPGAEEAKNKFMTSVFDELDGCKIGLRYVIPFCKVYWRGWLYLTAYFWLQQ